MAVLDGLRAGIGGNISLSCASPLNVKSESGQSSRCESSLLPE